MKKQRQMLSEHTIDPLYERYIAESLRYGVEITILSVEPHDMLEEMIVWIAENTNGLWFVQIETENDRMNLNLVPNSRVTLWMNVFDPNICRFSFSDLQDATLFRLRF